MKEPSFVPDELDLMILEHMSGDADVPFKQLAQSLKVDQRTIAKRVNDMKEKGVLRNKVEVDWSRLGLGIVTYVGAETGLGEKDLARLHEYIRKEPRVTEAYSTIGNQEYYFKVVETDLQSLREVLMPFEPITSKLTSSIVSSQIKKNDDVALLRFLRQRGFSRKKRKASD
ncbi:MAG TPA: Lrp/AsnC family transcriptional regulator [Candidatus Nitrosotalea sp.]|nr:Lrp/AsnC family transcriptional regulator [Candidatus Nitrosotalea sp.]